MDKNTGAALDEKNHILQSITDILTTPLGSRVMRRNYGSILFEFIDKPNNEALQLQIISAVIMALTEFEPRIEVIAANFVNAKHNLTLQLQFALKNSPASREFFSVSF